MHCSWLGLSEGLVGRKEVAESCMLPLYCETVLSRPRLTGVSPVITGSEAGFTYEDYSEPLMDGRSWSRLKRKRTSLALKSAALHQVRKRETAWESRPLLPWQLHQCEYYIDAELLSTPLKSFHVEFVSSCALWIYTEYCVYVLCFYLVSKLWACNPLKSNLVQLPDLSDRGYRLKCHHMLWNKESSPHGRAYYWASVSLSAVNCCGG